jgi:enolase
VQKAVKKVNTFIDKKMFGIDAHNQKDNYKVNIYLLRIT